jgi:hypothetical protein
MFSQNIFKRPIRAYANLHYPSVLPSAWMDNAYLRRSNKHSICLLEDEAPRRNWRIDRKLLKCQVAFAPSAQTHIGGK